MMALMMALETNRTQTFEDAIDYLMSMAQGGMSEYLAVMLASLLAGRGAMPRYLGLPKEDFDALLLHHFPGIDVFELLTDLLRSRQPKLIDILPAEAGAVAESSVVDSVASRGQVGEALPACADIPLLPALLTPPGNPSLFSAA